MPEIDINDILECYNECFPIKTKIISSRDQFEPSVNQSIKNDTLKQQNIYKLYQQGIISRL